MTAMEADCARTIPDPPPMTIDPKLTPATPSMDLGATARSSGSQRPSGSDEARAKARTLALKRFQLLRRFGIALLVFSLLWVFTLSALFALSCYVENQTEPWEWEFHQHISHRITIAWCLGSFALVSSILAMCSGRRRNRCCLTATVMVTFVAVVAAAVAMYFSCARLSSTVDSLRFQIHGEQERHKRQIDTPRPTEPVSPVRDHHWWNDIVVGDPATSTTTQRTTTAPMTRAPWYKRLVHMGEELIAGKHDSDEYKAWVRSQNGPKVTWDKTADRDPAQRSSFGEPWGSSGDSTNYQDGAQGEATTPDEMGWLRPSEPRPYRPRNTGLRGTQQWGNSRFDPARRRTTTREPTTTRSAFAWWKPRSSRPADAPRKPWWLASVTTEEMPVTTIPRPGGAGAVVGIEPWQRHHAAASWEGRRQHAIHHSHYNHHLPPASNRYPHPTPTTSEPYHMPDSHLSIYKTYAPLALWSLAVLWGIAQLILLLLIVVYALIPLCVTCNSGKWCTEQLVDDSPPSSVYVVSVAQEDRVPLLQTPDAERVES